MENERKLLLNEKMKQITQNQTTTNSPIIYKPGKTLKFRRRKKFYTPNYLRIEKILKVCKWEQNNDYDKIIIKKKTLEKIFSDLSKPFFSAKRFMTQQGYEMEQVDRENKNNLTLKFWLKGQKEHQIKTWVKTEALKSKNRIQKKRKRIGFDNFIPTEDDYNNAETFDEMMCNSSDNIITDFLSFESLDGDEIYGDEIYANNIVKPKFVDKNITKKVKKKVSWN